MKPFTVTLAEVQQVVAAATAVISPAIAVPPLIAVVVCLSLAMFEARVMQAFFGRLDSVMVKVMPLLITVTAPFQRLDRALPLMLMPPVASRLIKEGAKLVPAVA